MDIFDIIGPVMIGPSSSHTAGAVRIGYLTRMLLAEPAVEARVYLHGSFAHTYKGHGTDRAIAAGIMGMKPDNERIRNSLTLAKEQGLNIKFETIELSNAHPNTAFIEVKGIDGKKLSVKGSSIGGGNIIITEINGKQVEITGKSPTLVVEYSDIPGRIAAITSITARHRINISQIHIGRDYRGGTATMCLQMDGLSVDSTVKEDILKIDNVYDAILIQPV
ncbi:L-serine ammonia-lyase, iron-sulfur-dependent subunit beta [Treponema pedis]|uniref:L-serine dehydratase n=2 Tax=Treponema pedis TaxID=409322 RepID=S5ZXI8_9SPIR|nr:L-serine ammonia-lyase, iron-sulfur-dependent subunit beta [Treponema pedis]AGT42718.1 L-serine dehydratase, iron-sulfur-dependent subunit beta [Treponema pedis str. T A4]QOW61733.1 L-serine ammonia-lyase, iron-sulfur-dependent, subunit beta [Treponema pedis]QSI03601.1 L-serine ammonia-lyase, iron-sulfur-dependent, subunit beta [Treponema pedis]